jgi:hypothetical protein
VKTRLPGFLERRLTARAIADVPTEQLERFRDHAAALGLDPSREHYEALLADRARRERRKEGRVVKTPDPDLYVTKIDPALSRKDGPLQVLSSPKPQPAKGAS